ncbi:Surface polysaccharide O-acyltransferase, integral membrane enzyme [Prevotella sp. khp1]|nr:Surface polysaccharide O-acyltransferase, integral membrane enzyme [Prevotella sp. khp1]
MTVINVNKTEGRNGSIDALRLILAFIVVTNHTCIFGLYAQDIIDCAVPVFLMISGYYFTPSTLEEEKARYAKNIKKLTPILIGSILLYILWDVVKYYIFEINTPYSISTLWTCANLFCPPLWYIHAFLYLNVILWVVTTISSHLNKEVSIRKTPTFVLLLIAFLLWVFIKSQYHIIFGWNIILCFVFFVIGVLIRRFSINNFDNRLVIAMGGAFSIFISVVLRKYGIQELSGLDIAYHFPTVLLSICLLLLFAKLHISSTNVISQVGRKYSLHIYIVHWMIIEIFNLANNFQIPPLIRPFAVTLISLLLSMLYVKGKHFFIPVH